MEDERAPLRHLQTLSSLPPDEQGKSIISPEGIWKARAAASPGNTPSPVPTDEPLLT